MVRLEPEGFGQMDMKKLASVCLPSGCMFEKYCKSLGLLDGSLGG